MTIATLPQIQMINNMVRDHFKLSLKSDNKIYSMDYGNKDPAMKEWRNINARRAEARLKTIRRHETDCDKMLGFDVDKRAGNCGEYAAMLLHFSRILNCPAWEFETESAIGTDHIFFVFNLDRHPSYLASVGNMATNNHYPQAIVCDSWANVVCQYNEYPHAISAKTTKWDSQGKRMRSFTSEGTWDTQSAGEWLSDFLATPVYAVPKIGLHGQSIPHSKIYHPVIGDIFGPGRARKNRRWYVLD